MKSGTDIRQVLQESPLKVARIVAPNFFVLDAGDAATALREAQRLAGQPEVLIGCPIQRRQQVRKHGPYAPAAYPEVHHVTSPLRKKAAASGDAQGMALWAGQGHRMARELPAGQLVEVLAAEIDAARTALSGKGDLR